jgi:ATP-dependent helicase/nuclease subunit A
MNVHQAKGLEAPIVFLAGVSGGNNGSITQHVRRGQDGRNQLVSPVIDEGYHGINTGHAPLGWDYGRDAPFKDLEKAYVEAEEQRLHYVAATRAKNLLVVSCQLKKDKQFADKDGISGYSPWQDLAEQTKDAPLLAVPPASADVDGAGADNLVINGHTHQRVQAIARRSIERTTFTTVSKEKEGERSTLSHGEGYGKDFGTVVHKLMEGMINQRDSSTGRLGPLPERGTIRAMLPDPEFGKIGKEGDKSSSATPPPWQLVPVARRMLTGFRDSKLGQTLASTKTVYTEYPFTSHEKSPGDDSPNTLVRGTIDLVYRDANGWHIVDFKTDRITSAEAAAALDPDHAYRDQIRQYAGAWQALTGEPVASGSLWFTESGTRVYIDEK